jgi:hypothetical protein
MTKARNSKSLASTLTGAMFAMSGTLDATHGADVDEGAMLDNLLADLTGGEEIVEQDASVTGDVGEILETSAQPALPHDEALLESAVDDADRTIAKQALYSEQSGDGEVIEGDAPVTTPEAVADAKAAKKEAKALAAAAKKTEREAKSAAKKAAKAAAPKAAPRPTSVTHKPGDLLVAKLGASYRDYLTFSVAYANSDDTIAQETRQNEFVERMNDNDAIADKVKEKMTMLLTWLQKGGELNEVLKRTFTVLHTAGELTSGDKGNLQLNLLSKPYSMGTARSQANQMFMALPELALTIKEKGRMVANPDSALLPAIYAKLGL